MLVATGRRPRSAEAGLAREGLRPPAVLLDGALGQDFATGRRFHRAPFEPAVARTVLDAFTSAGISPCLYVDRDDADVVVGDAPSTHPAHLANLGPWLRTADLNQEVATDDILAIGIVGGPRAPLEEVAASLTGMAEAAIVRDLLYGDATLIVRPPGISKWQGVEAYCAAQDLDPAKVLALGDGENDIELLTNAAVACVVSDGCDAALALADHIIDPASQGGWCAVLDLI